MKKNNDNEIDLESLCSYVRISIVEAIAKKQDELEAISSKPHFILLLHSIMPFALCRVYYCQFIEEILENYMERYLEEDKNSLIDIQGAPFPISVLKYLIRELNTHLLSSFEDMNLQESRQFVQQLLEVFSQFCKENLLIPVYETLLEELIDEHRNRNEIFGGHA